MKNVPTPRLSYANVVSTLCLFILLGGGAYAATQLPKNSVGARQLKNGSVTGAKVAANTLTGDNIQSATLGTVPKATHAASADSASHAASADSAGNANTLGGSPASAFADRCPAGTHPTKVNLCISEAESHINFTEALAECAGLGLRLMTPSEAYTVKPQFSTWTDDFWTNGANSYALAWRPEFTALIAGLESEESNRYCVTTLSNS